MEVVDRPNPVMLPRDSYTVFLHAIDYAVSLFAATLMAFSSMPTENSSLFRIAL